MNNRIFFLFIYFFLFLFNYLLYRHNIVSLEILRSLIQACHRDLNLFSKNIVKILLMMLDNKDKDIQLIDLACETVSFYYLKEKRIKKDNNGDLVLVYFNNIFFSLSLYLFFFYNLVCCLL